MFSKFSCRTRSEYEDFIQNILKELFCEEGKISHQSDPLKLNLIIKLQLISFLAFDVRDRDWI